MSTLRNPAIKIGAVNHRDDLEMADFLDAQMERIDRKCRCRSCGRSFDRGTEGDNETICLRCERIEFISRDDYDSDNDMSMNY